MKILVAQNHHVGPGGTEVLFRGVRDLLRDKGHDVFTVEKDNAQLRGVMSKLGAFKSAVYCKQSKKQFEQILARERPDVAHFFNIYPLLSVSVIDACYEARVPVVLAVQDFKYTCPTAQHLRHGEICEKCMGGHEWNCAINNCRKSWPMSIAYAVRNRSVRKRGTLKNRASVYLAPTKFVGDQIIKDGFDASRVMVVSNPSNISGDSPKTNDGEYVAYVGRISPEKGLPILIEAARKTGLATKIAGDWSPMPELNRNLPKHVQLLGKLSREELPDFYRRARFLVVPSVWFEAFGIVAAEAMSFGLPVIASRIGGLPEVVDHEKDGLLVPHNNIDALAEAMQGLWNDPTRARAMGEVGRQKAIARFHPDRFYEGLIGAYRKAIDERSRL